MHTYAWLVCFLSKSCSASNIICRRRCCCAHMCSSQSLLLNSTIARTTCAHTATIEMELWRKNRTPKHTHTHRYTKENNKNTKFGIAFANALSWFRFGLRVPVLVCIHPTQSIWICSPTSGVHLYIYPTKYDCITIVETLSMSHDTFEHWPPHIAEK